MTREVMVKFKEEKEGQGGKSSDGWDRRRETEPAQ